MKTALPWIGAALAACLATIAKAESLEHVQQLLQTNQCANCDLSRSGLVYADLSAADLSAADLSHANLSRANLSAANLSGANLAGATLVSANLSGANLTAANLRGANLRGAILTGANVEGATLEAANFLGAIGLPSEIATADHLYRLGLAETERGNYRGAIGYYNRVLQMEPTLANAYLARGIAQFQLGNQAAALADSQQAEQLYLAQNHELGQRLANQFSQGIAAVQDAAEQQEEQMRGNGIGTRILNFLGVAASLLLRFGL
jgi:uncharacterized protein YjbI with pentapeptide repeats